MKQSMAERVESKLRAALTPTHLEVINESHQHSVGPGAESHFKVIVVSPLFEGKNLIEQQRLVYSTLADELKQAIHALTLKTIAPSKWQPESGSYESPACRGGSKA
ncbi:MAG: BolA family transcriptional regulator [Myxococcales bacterium]|nr:BolA family transcriptional regulator [Myxococcales bacterium]